MANKVKGEVGFDADGKSYRLVLDLNALCEAEEHVPGILDGDLSKMKSVRSIRGVFWAGLQRHHKGLALTDAGDLIQAIGVPEAGRLIAEAVSAAWGSPEETASADPQ